MTPIAPDGGHAGPEETGMTPINDEGERPWVESFSAFASREFAPLEWVWDGLIPRGGMTILGGAPKSGKTYLSLGIAVAVATGMPFLDRPTIRGSVLYVLEEGAAGGIADRIRKITGQFGSPDGAHLIHRRNIKIGDPTWDKLVATIASIQPMLLILDPLAFLHSASDENQSAPMIPVMREILALASAKTAVLLIHHNTKAGADAGTSSANAIRGSSAIIGSSDSNLVLSRRNRQGTKLRLESESRDAGSSRIQLAFDGDNGVFSLAEDEGEDREANVVSGYPRDVQPSDLLALIAAAANGASDGAGITSADVARMRRVSDQTALNGLNAATKSGLLTCSREGRTNVYRIAA